MKVIIAAIVLSIFSSNVFALKGEDRYFPNRNKTKPAFQNKIVDWEGVVTDDGSHDNRHKHSLKFIRKSDGKQFDIVESASLEKLHCDKSKELLVKVKAEKTPKFLFWGGNLKVKEFEVIKELESIAHSNFKQRKVRNHRSRLER